MSQKYPGGIISKTAPVPTGPFENGTAPGVWTLEQQAEFVKQGIWPIAGLRPDYIEDVFSTWLYTGNGSTQTITNGIDLAGEGGLVWLKQRNEIISHTVVDTARGNTKIISTNNTGAQGTYTTAVTGFNSNGFSLGNDSDWGGSNTSGGTYASWTFRKQPKFFDVVTFTSASSGDTTFNHDLGSAPGCVIIKNTGASSGWIVYHRSVGNDNYLRLNGTGAQESLTGAFSATSTSFTVKSDLTDPSNSYVAYLFAHNAGGFGLTGTDNVISCGSYTGNGSTTGPIVTLGYEPQWVMIKNATSDANWVMYDTMRGFTNGGIDATLFPNLSAAEDATNTALIRPLATGFQPTSTSGTRNASGETYIYIAIRRPMKVPTTGTSVFSPNATSNDSVALSTGFPVDLAFGADRSGSSDNFILVDRLRGSPSLRTASTSAETGIAGPKWANNTGFAPTAWGSSANTVWEMFRRAPGFFDEVCYTQTSTSGDQVVAHNLTVAPELVIIKSRNESYGWNVWPVALNNRLILNETTAASTFGPISGVTSTSFLEPMYQLGTPIGTTYVAYLFATCPGVSKVGSYTGTGTTQTINCGFTAGARFVLIKATSTTGNWLVWDSARGIVSGNDPYLELNTTDAEVTNTDWVDTAATGFELSNAGGNLANSSGVSYIFLAIA